MAFKHFIWDFDGTLYDTYQGIVAAVARGLDEMGIPRPDQREITRLAKTTLRQACIELAGEERAEELHGRFFVHSKEMGLDPLRPFPGCREALQAVVDAGSDNFLYTHRNHQAVEALERDGLSPLFRDYITAEAGFPGKPAPDALMWLCQQHDLKPEDCVVIGDRSIDLDAAKNAGIAAVLFDPDGYHAPVPGCQVFSRLTDIPEQLLK